MGWFSGRTLVAGAMVTTALWGACGCDGAPGRAAAPSGEAPTAGGQTPHGGGRPKIPAGMIAGYAVFDRRAGRVTVQHDARRPFRSASVVKILIALDYLERRGGRAIPPADLALLRPMLRSSDDGAASALWARGGRKAIIERMVPRLGLAQTAPPPPERPTAWGFTAISATDIVRTYRYLLDRAAPGHRAFILGELRRATRCGRDLFDQSFGIPRALPRPWAVKQGWSGFGETPDRPCSPPPPRVAMGRGRLFHDVAAPDLGLGRPVLHTTGVVGERLIVVVLTLQPAGSSFRSSAARVTALTKDVYRAGGG